VTHGLDVTGWEGPDGFSPSVAVVCGEPSAAWRIDADGCEACE
jgi:hypothetical protein